MPQNFTKQVDTVNPKTNPYADQAIDTRGTSTTETVAGAVATAVKAYTQYKDSKVLGQLVSEAEGIQASSTDYASIKNDLLNRLDNESSLDRSVFNDYAKQLERLNAGQVQGVLSPSAAQIRLNELARSYISRYPHLAPEVRQLLAASAGNFGGGDSGKQDEDPLARARDKFLEDARANQASPQAWRNHLDIQRFASDAKAAVDEKMAQGTLQLPDITAALNHGVQSKVSSLIIAFNSEVANGTFDKVNNTAQLVTAISGLDKELDFRLLQTMREQHILLSKDNIEQVKSEVLGPLRALIPLFDKSDSQENQLRHAQTANKMLEEASFRSLAVQMDAMSIVLLSRSPDKVLDYFNDQASMWNTLVRPDKKTGQLTIDNTLLGSYKKLAETNPVVRNMLDSILKSDGWKQIASDLVARTDGANPPDDPNEAMGKIKRAMALDFAARSFKGREVLDEQRNVLASILLTGHYEEFLQRTDVHRILADPSSKRLQADVESDINQRIQYDAKNASHNDLAKVDLDLSKVDSPQGPFSGTFQRQVPRGRLGGIAATENLPIVDSLNNAFKVIKIYKSPDEAAEWAKKALYEGVFINANDVIRIEGPLGLRAQMSAQPNTPADTAVGADRYFYDAAQDVWIDQKGFKTITDNSLKSLPEAVQQQLLALREAANGR